MNSKEALDYFVALCTLNFDKEGAKRVNIIKKDLSVLEIIKKYYDIELTYTGLKISYKKDAPMSYSGFAEEERKTIEGWLNNEK